MSPQTTKRLTGWKQIATCAMTSVRTAQRWERAHGLPVHRLSVFDRGNVFSTEAEIQEWLVARRSRPRRAARRTETGSPHAQAQAPSQRALAGRLREMARQAPLLFAVPMGLLFRGTATAVGMARRFIV